MKQNYLLFIILFSSIAGAQVAVKNKMTVISKISVNNTSSPSKKSGYYNWTVFIQADDATLNTIDHVEYLLDPTFPNPQVSSYNRTNNFSYTSIGWGEFEIKVKVIFKDERVQYIPYWLRLQSKIVKPSIKTVKTTMVKK